MGESLFHSGLPLAECSPQGGFHQCYQLLHPRQMFPGIVVHFFLLLVLSADWLLYGDLADIMQSGY